MKSVKCALEKRTVMTDRYKKIRKALSMGPTPGPWLVCRTNSGTFVKSERFPGYFVEVRHFRPAQDTNADASFIAACDPDTIRALLDENEALRAEVAEWKARAAFRTEHAALEGN